MNLRKKIGEKLFGDRVDTIINHILSFLKPGDTIIDLGAGTCLFTKLLRAGGHSVTPVDIKNRSYYPDIASTVYDGEHLPFTDETFDACILIAVLHHTPHPEAVLKEAVRVSKKLVIYEDAITNVFQRFYTYLIDSVLNKELITPRTNKTDAQWKILFKKIGLRLAKAKYEKSWLILHNPIYFLEKMNNIKSRALLAN